MNQVTESMITILLNDQPFQASAGASESLLDFLRTRALATEVKCGCGRGDCGTCAVLFDGRVVKSCLVLARQANGKHVYTIRGLGQDSLMANLQESFIKQGAIQCGFCTPGMLMAAYYLLKIKPTPTRSEIRQGIAGNLCRCTGYQKIVDAIEAVARKAVPVPDAPNSTDSPIPAPTDQEKAKAGYLLLGGG
jgi:aerobic-type carbon monoxide dehydrogenase small subunit (CoxS/CutS family)